MLQEMPHRLLFPELISYSAAALACQAGVQWKQALMVLHRMRSFLHEHCQHATISSAPPCLVLAMQACALCFNTLIIMPHIVFGCPGLVAIHKPPGWEVGARDLTSTIHLDIWL